MYINYLITNENNIELTIIIDDKIRNSPVNRFTGIKIPNSEQNSSGLLKYRLTEYLPSMISDFV